jgi:hypothetical protein
MGITVGKSYDLNAAEFFNATQVLTPIQKQAVNDLVKDLKNYGVWTKMKAVYPMVGQVGVSSSFQFNLKDTSTFKGIFNGGWTFNSTGATPDGISAYMDSGLNASSNLTRSNNHISFYSRTQNSSGNYWNIGGEIAPAISNLGVYFNAVSNKVFLSGVYPTYAAYINITNTLGLHIGSQTSSTSQKLYQNSSLLATNTVSNTLALPNLNYWVGAANNNGSVGSPAPHECAFASIGDGLTDTEAANFYTAVQRFQTTLGRQV